MYVCTLQTKFCYRKYLVLASNTVRPGQIFRVHVHLIKAQHPLIVRASLSCDNAEVSSGSEEVTEGDSTIILLQVITI